MIFGSFTIFAIYLLSSEFFSKRISLIAAFLTAIAPFHIKLTVGEMDVMAMFFVIMSILLFVKGIKSSKKIHFIISGIAMGLALYTKVYPILFIPSLLIYFTYNKIKLKEKVFNIKNFYLVSLFILSAFLFAVPALTHNYLLYQDKGFLDLQFTRTLGLGKNNSEQYYGWDHQFNAKNDWSGLILGNSSNYGNLPDPTLWLSINFLRKGNPSVFYLGIIGIILMLIYRKNRDYAILCGLLILFALPFLASIILLPKHYLFLELFMIPIAAFTLDYSLDYIKKNYNMNLLKPLLIILLIFSFIVLGMLNTGTTPHYFGKSAITQAIQLKDTEIKDSSLIVTDSRIYRGQANWVSYGRPYLEGADFIELLNSQDNSPGRTINSEVYFIECSSDDCGWGTIKDQPELNQTMEQLTEIFDQQGILIKDISEPSRDLNYYPLQEDKIQSRFRVYKLTLPLNEEILTIASQPKNWFLYEIGYAHPKDQFDSFKTETFFKKSLYSLARKIVLLSIILSILSLFYVLFESFGRNLK